MSTVEESIIETQRKIISIQDELNATNDSIIALLKKDNDMMRTKLAPYLAQEEEDRAENAIDLEQYMGYTKPRTGTFVPYPNEQTSSIVDDIVDTNEYLREQD